MEKKYNSGQLIQAVLSALFLLLELTVLKPCGPKEDGTFMHCHAAWIAVCVLAAVMLVFGLVLPKGKEDDN